jgi:hypothetical protein
MGSVPKPDYLNIAFDPKRAARRPPEQLWVFVAVRWRVEKDVPGIISVLSEIPEAPRRYDFKVVRRGDGRYTLEPDGWQKPKIDRVVILFEYARQGNVAFGYAESKENAELLRHTLTAMFMSIDPVGGSRSEQTIPPRLQA